MVKDRAIVTTGGPIEIHTRSIESCHFQLPWANPNPVFKVAEYLKNGYRYGHSYYI